MIFLTGGTGKIGRQIIKELSAAGHNICYTSRDPKKIEEIDNQYLKINEGKGFVRGVHVDLETDGYLSILDEFMRVNNMFPSVLINNARNVRYLKIEESGIVSEENWIGEFKLGVIIPYHLSQHFTHAPNSKLKRIINIASMYGIVAPNRTLYNNLNAESSVQYGTVKSSLIHLTKELAVRLADKGVAVNSISYGGVEGREDAAFNKRYSKLNPQSRMLNDSDVVGPIEFLISSGASGMNGHNLICDGGWTIW